jgi:hypothetical protein
VGATAPAQRAQPRLLLVIGQFEQVFTMCREEGERCGDPTPQGHLGISALRGKLAAAIVRSSFPSYPGYVADQKDHPE